MAVPTLETGWSETTVINNSTINVNEPTGWSAGDLCVVLIAVDNSDAPQSWTAASDPAGWTLSNVARVGTLESDVECAAYYRILEAGDFSGGTEAFTEQTSNPGYDIIAYALRITGHNSSTPIDVHAVGRESGVVIDAQDETSYDNTPTTEGTFAGGSGHAVSDVITVTNGTTVTVDAVSSGVVTEFTVDSSLDVGGNVSTDTLSQTATTGSGTGFSLTLDTDNVLSANPASLTINAVTTTQNDCLAIGFGCADGVPAVAASTNSWTPQDDGNSNAASGTYAGWATKSIATAGSTLDFVSGTAGGNGRCGFIMAIAPGGTSLPVFQNYYRQHNY